MTIDAQLERLYQQIELVRGSGDPKRRRLCIMSFVAFLTGEAHTDNPSTASSLIRRYAMVVNDEMPDGLRQRLKAFAPRLIGTNDGEDLARVHVLAEAARDEILPRVESDFGLRSSTKEVAPAPCKGTRKQAMTLQELVDKVAGLAAPSSTSASDSLPSELAKLIAHCGKCVQGARGEWYWLKAVDLLDRLCDVIGDQSRPVVQPERLASIEVFLNRRDEAQPHLLGAVAALARVRNLISGFHALTW